MKEFRCALCGGNVRSNFGPGRKYEYIIGFPRFDIPDDAELVEN